MATPSTATVQVTASEFTEQATARARKLLEVTNDLGGLELTERERDTVMHGITLGVASSLEVLTAHATPTSDAAETADTPPAGPSSPEPPPSQ